MAPLTAFFAGQSARGRWLKVARKKPSHLGERVDPVAQLADLVPFIRVAQVFNGMPPLP